MRNRRKRGHPVYHRDHPAQRRRRRQRRIITTRNQSPAFLDGPAAGEHLPVNRAPRFLRVTQNGPCFRVLDGEGDEPEETELIYVYEIVGKPTRRRILANRSTYRFLDLQPKDSRIRRIWSWRAWATEQNEQKNQPP